MLARTADEVLGENALIDLYAAVAKLAVADVCSGPGYSPKQQRDYQTAVQFLDRAGLLDRVLQQYGLEVEATDVQLELFV